MVKKRITEAVTSNDNLTKRWRSTFASARMAYETGELRQAQTLLARARELAEQIPERHFAVPTTEIAMAAVLLADRKGKEAESRLNKVLRTLEGSGSADQKELWAVGLRFHAQALADKGDVREAEKELMKSIDTLQALGPDAAVQRAYSLSDLCGLYAMQGRISEAENSITTAMHILGNCLGTDSPEYVRSDMIYALCLPMESCTRIEVAKEGLGQMEYMYGSAHPQIIRALERFLKVLSDRGDNSRLEEVKERFCTPATMKRMGRK